MQESEIAASNSRLQETIDKMKAHNDSLCNELSAKQSTIDANDIVIHSLKKELEQAKQQVESDSVCSVIISYLFMMNGVFYCQ